MNDDARQALLRHPCRLVVLDSLLETGRIGEALNDELAELFESDSR